MALAPKYRKFSYGGAQMENCLCEYMTIQVEEVKKFLENLREEHAALLGDDTQRMKMVLEERGKILEMLERLGNIVGREMGKLGISTLDETGHSQVSRMKLEIDWLMEKIDRWNERNKLLLESHGTRHS